MGMAWRIGKWAIGILAGLALVVVLAVLAIVLLVNPNRFKGVVQDKVRAATGQPFEIQGDLHIAWYPWLGVKTGSSQFGKPADAVGAPLVRWKTLQAEARLVPLLQGQLEVGRVRIEGLEINLRRYADGRANWDELLSARGDGAAASPPAAMELQGVEIRDGLLSYEDVQSGTTLRLSRWQLNLFPLHTSFTVQGGPLPAAVAVALDAPVFGLPPAQGAWSLKPLDIRLDRTQLRGALARNAHGAWRIDLHGDRIDLDRYIKSSDKPFEPPIEALRALRLEGVVAFDEIAVKGATLRDVRLTLDSSTSASP